MKKITFTLLIALLAGAAVFAEGNQEQNAPAYGRGQGMMDPQRSYRYDDSYTGEVLEITGEIELQDNALLN